MTEGIYKIQNWIDNKIYIGSSKNIKRRFNAHRSYLNNGIHPNDHLQNAWNIYGHEIFVFEILEVCVEDKLNTIEQKWIDKFDSSNNEKGYNLRPTAQESKQSEETKRKISIAKKGVKLPPRTELYKINLRLSKLGKKRAPFSQEWKDKLSSNSHLKNKRMPLETRIKISEAKKLSWSKKSNKLDLLGHLNTEECELKRMNYRSIKKAMKMFEVMLW